MDEEEFREKLIGALKFMGGGELSGPSGLEGLAMALAGGSFVTNGTSVAQSLDRIAEAIDRLAAAIEAQK